MKYDKRIGLELMCDCGHEREFHRSTLIDLFFRDIYEVRNGKCDICKCPKFIELIST